VSSLSQVSNKQVLTNNSLTEASTGAIVTDRKEISMAIDSESRLLAKRLWPIQRQSVAFSEGTIPYHNAVVGLGCCTIELCRVCPTKCGARCDLDAPGSILDKHSFLNLKGIVTGPIDGVIRWVLCMVRYTLAPAVKNDYLLLTMIQNA
jgi:hypothetical protein